MAWYGSDQHGKTEVRKELALIAMAHRGVFVHQSSQASASHLMSGLLRGLQKRRPAVFNIYTPCPVEHGLADDMAQHAARLALESRAFPYLTYDPDAGPGWADCLSLDGNPSVEDDWPTYTLEYVDADGSAKSMELPLTIADWAATEGRFRKHFKKAKPDADGLVAFHEYVALDAEGRAGSTPFIHMLGEGRTLERWTVSAEIVRLAEERLLHWSQLRELAGEKVAESTRSRMHDALQSELDAKLDTARREYEAKIAEMQATYPAAIARRLAEGLLGAARSGQTVQELIAGLPVTRKNGAAHATLPSADAAPPPVVSPAPIVVAAPAPPAPAPAAPAHPAPAHPAPAHPAPAHPAPAQTEAIAIEAYIESERCTTCNECTNANRKMFAYNQDKQAYIKDPRAGTFAQLVQAAEKCPVGAIHPGTPLNPNEKDLEKWLKRAQAF
jgi:pyruvate-ferredoxin/flavodoxin oxidoreductase